MYQYEYIWKLMSSKQMPVGEGLELYHTIYIKVKMTKNIILCYILGQCFSNFWRPQCAVRKIYYVSTLSTHVYRCKTFTEISQDILTLLSVICSDYFLILSYPYY